MHDAVRNKYDLVMSSGKEGGPYQTPLFRLRGLPGLSRIVLVTSRCTATATFSAPGFPPANLSGVYVSDGNELLLIDTGTVVTSYRNVATPDPAKLLGLVRVGLTYTHKRNFIRLQFEVSDYKVALANRALQVPFARRFVKHFPDVRFVRWYHESHAIWNW